MSDLVKRLRIKAGMIEMGELIAWGSDSALMREAADALERAEPAVQGEPVACEVVGRAYHESFGSGVRLKLYIDAHQWPITQPIPIGTKLYFHPHPTEQRPAPDVTQLVEALEALLEVRVVKADVSYGLACAKAEKAIAAYRKGGGEIRINTNSQEYEMDKYKLVPVEPTQEMLDAAIQDGGCVDGKPVWKKSVTFQAKWKYQQMLAAAPAVQGEVVGWQFYQDGEWWYGDDRIKLHRKNTEAAGIPVRDVYAVPQADYEYPQHELEAYKAACNEWLEKSQWVQETLVAKELGMHRADVMKSRVEALQAECEKLVEALNLMVTTHDEGGWPTATITIARAALAAYRNQGVEEEK